MSDLSDAGWVFLEPFVTRTMLRGNFYSRNAGQVRQAVDFKRFIILGEDRLCF
jgi:hypothetical protein